jgi:hypothetical protein
VRITLPACDLRGQAVVLLDDVASSGHTLATAAALALAANIAPLDAGAASTTQPLKVGAITAPDITASGDVTVTGTPQVGLDLTAGNNLTDPDGTISDLAYQWQSSTDGSTWSNINGATASTFTLTSSEQGKSVRAVASYSAGGFTNFVAATSTAAVVAAPTVSISNAYADTSSYVTDTFYTPVSYFNYSYPITSISTAYWTVYDPRGLYWMSSSYTDMTGYTNWYLAGDLLCLGSFRQSGSFTKTFYFNGGAGFNSLSFLTAFGGVSSYSAPVSVNFYNASGGWVGGSSFTFGSVTSYGSTSTFSASFSCQAKYFTITPDGYNSFAMDNLTANFNAGYISNGGSTIDTTPTLSGSISRALITGEQVEVYRDGSKIGNASISVGSTS